MLCFRDDDMKFFVDDLKTILIVQLSCKDLHSSTEEDDQNEEVRKDII